MQLDTINSIQTNNSDCNTILILFAIAVIYYAVDCLADANISNEIMSLSEQSSSSVIDIPANLNSYINSTFSNHINEQVATGVLERNNLSFITNTIHVIINHGENITYKLATFNTNFLMQVHSEAIYNPLHIPSILIQEQFMSAFNDLALTMNGQINLHFTIITDKIIGPFSNIKEPFIPLKNLVLYHNCSFFFNERCLFPQLPYTPNISKFILNFFANIRDFMDFLYFMVHFCTNFTGLAERFEQLNADMGYMLLQELRSKVQLLRYIESFYKLLNVNYISSYSNIYFEDVLYNALIDASLITMT